MIPRGIGGDVESNREGRDGAEAEANREGEVEGKGHQTATKRGFGVFEGDQAIGRGGDVSGSERRDWRGRRGGGGSHARAFGGVSERRSRQFQPGSISEDLDCSDRDDDRDNNHPFAVTTDLALRLARKPFPPTSPDDDKSYLYSYLGDKSTYITNWASDVLSACSGRTVSSRSDSGGSQFSRGGSQQQVQQHQTQRRSCSARGDFGF
jgi:hypothetical protein